MKIAGHTLGTPGMSIEEALHLFKRAGLDAAELIWTNDYSAAIPEEGGEAIIRRIRDVAGELGLEIVGLTPYMSDFNSLDDNLRQRDIDRMHRCIEATAALGATNIRVYAGSYQPGDSQREEKWERLVDAMKTLGQHAHEAGVKLCAENHFNTMTVSAAETVALVEAVNSPGVGILYDQANLAFTYNEPYDVAIPLQRNWISHVHVKDLIFVDDRKEFKADQVARVKAEDRAVRSRVVGDGVLDWPAILKALVESGYSGYLSLEYEYRWHPQDLPAPLIGFRQGAETIRHILANLEIAS